MAQKTLHDVVHEQILEGKTGAAKRGFSPGRSSQLKFPLVTRMSWRGLARVALRAGGQVVPAPTPRRRHAPRGLRYTAGHRTDLSDLRLDHPDRVCRAPQSRHPPAGGGHRTPGQYAVPGRNGLAGSAGPVSGLSQLRVASRQSAPAGAAPRSYQRLWLGEKVAAVHTSDGGRVDGSHVVAQRSAPLPGAAVAASSSAITRSPGR